MLHSRETLRRLEPWPTRAEPVRCCPGLVPDDGGTRAIADVLRTIGGAIATVVTLPFRAVDPTSSLRDRRAGEDGQDGLLGRAAVQVR
jgi:hypothetical protein